MKQQFVRIWWLIAASSALFSLVGCGSQAANQPNAPSPAAQAMAKGLKNTANAAPASSNGK